MTGVRVQRTFNARLTRVKHAFNCQDTQTNCPQLAMSGLLIARKPRPAANSGLPVALVPELPWSPNVRIALVYRPATTISERRIARPPRTNTSYQSTQILRWHHELIN